MVENITEENLVFHRIDKEEEEKNVSSTGFLKGSKYYVSCRVSQQEKESDMESDNGQNEEIKGEFFVDTGAECSIISSSLVTHFKKRTDASLKLKGFTGQVGAEVNEIVDVTLNLVPVSINCSFYVCDVETSIIGSDLLRDESLNISLNTQDELLTVDGTQILTSRSLEDSIENLEEREKEWKNRGLMERNWPKVERNYWMSNRRTVSLDPSSVTMVDCKIEPNFRTDSKFAFLSFYDKEIHSVYIPSVTF